MLEYAGLRSPLILEGGFRAWKDSKYPIEKNRNPLKTTEFEIHPNLKVLATAGYVRSLTANGGIVLDVRSEEEFEGTENRECCPRAGRVPGALWFEWINFLDGDGRFEGRRLLDKRLRSLGVGKASEIGVYCHRGARAAAAFYALRSMGYHRARNFVGSWHEWSSKKSLPVETETTS
jgi:thiosulfate/3-mercaptopyruvate sulfurtransferase